MRGDFLSLCKNPELACEVTLQPLERYPLDAAILFSDILTIPDAMGLGLYFETGEGPRFRHPVRTAEDVDRLEIAYVEQSLDYVMNAVRTIRQVLDGRVPLIGFSAAHGRWQPTWWKVAVLAIFASSRRCSTISRHCSMSCWPGWQIP